MVEPALGLPRLGCYKGRVRGRLFTTPAVSMDTGSSVERCVGAAGRVALIGVAAFGLALAGCSSFSGGGGVSDWFPSVPGFSNVATSGDRSAMAAADAPWVPSMDNDCPSLYIRQGASTLAIATKTQQATAND